MSRQVSINITVELPVSAITEEHSVPLILQMKAIACVVPKALVPNAAAAHAASASPAEHPDGTYLAPTSKAPCDGGQETSSGGSIAPKPMPSQRLHQPYAKAGAVSAAETREQKHRAWQAEGRQRLPERAAAATTTDEASTTG
jgi:hypothetical protein